MPPKLVPLELTRQPLPHSNSKDPESDSIGRCRPSLICLLQTPGSRDFLLQDRKMETLVVGVLGIALFVVIVAFFVHPRRQLSTAAETSSSDDETSGPLSVNVVADHDEQDSLLPKFAGLLRSPWHSVSAGQKEQQKVMRPVRKGSRSMSLTMPSPLRKKWKPTEVPVKKVHVPYFFPLLDETAEWWQAQQCAAGETQATPEQEPEADPESRSSEDDVSSCNQCKGDTPVSEVSAKELLQVDRPHHFAAAKMAATPIEVGGH